MFDTITYKPYANTSFDWSSSSVLNISCPWLSIDIDVELKKVESLTKLIQQFNRAPLNHSTTEAQRFLLFLQEYPLVHVNPRAILDESVSPYASSAPEIMEADSPVDFLCKINKFEAIDPNQVFDYFPAKWEWDQEKIYTDSRIPGTSLFDPYSVYTAIRQQRLQFQIDNSDYAQKLLKKLEELRLNDETHFFKIMSVILSQQYYVTRECCSCLNPAMNFHSFIRDEIRAYMGEEIQHDKLILNSINKISELPPEEFYFAPEVQMEIEVIKYAANTCALGFSALVSIMEGTVYPESDPVGDILKRSSRPESHAGVESHFQINRRNNHTAIPETFVSKIPPVTKETVEIATRLAEVTIRLDTGLALSMLRYIDRNS